MSANKKARDAFKEMVNLCYEEEYPELHKELLSLESSTRRNKDAGKYELAMKEVLNIIPVFADDFPQDKLMEIENIYQEYLEIF